MNLLLYSLLIYLFLFDYILLKSGVIPRFISWTPELISGIVFLVILVNFTKNRVLLIPVKYIIFFALLIIFLAIGILVNQVQPGAIFAGFRRYFKYAPFFLLPLVYSFNEKDISKLIKVLLVFSLIQLPVAIYQKLVIYKVMPTGDVIEGTVINSGKLAIYLICAISIVLAFYLKGRLTLTKSLIFIFILFLPTAITEASAAFILLPLAFVIPMFFVKISNCSDRSLMPITLIAVTLFLGFVTIYNIQYGERWGGNILNMLSTDRAVNFIYKGATEKNTTKSSKGEDVMREIGRFDSIMLPIKILSKQGDKVLYGVGIGNASASFSHLLVGEYSWVVDEYGGSFTTISTLLWETGILGVLFSYIFLLMVFYDSVKLIHNQDSSGAIALGWLGVIAIFSLSMIYTNLIDHNIIIYLMSLFSGHLIARAYLKKLNFEQEYKVI